MRLDRTWIAAHIAHQGRMCLLEQVLRWDAQHIECSTGTHRAADNPLRSHGRLGAACAIEYAAQAMALHGALLQPLAPGGAGFGVLTSAREVDLRVARLDGVLGDLLVTARRLHGDTHGALYGFSLLTLAPGTEAQLLARGRASLLLDGSKAKR